MPTLEIEALRVEGELLRVVNGKFEFQDGRVAQILDLHDSVGASFVVRERNFDDFGVDLNILLILHTVRLL